MLNWIIEIGFFLGLLANAILFLPQAIKLYKQKDSSGIAISTFLGFNVIQAFVILHAYIVHDFLLLIGTMLAFITCGFVTYLAVLYRK